MEFNQDYNELDFDTNGIDPALTAAWKAARLQKFTSSKIAKLRVEGTKGAIFGVAAVTYIYKVAAEALTLDYNEASSAAIKWGEEWEPRAAEAFETALGVEVIYYGKANPLFVEYEKFPNHCGGSPDGEVVSQKAIVEYKCPYESGNHAEMLRLVKLNQFDLRKFDADYYGQVQFNILLKKADFGYFVSYDPRVIDPALRLVYVKIEKDEKYLSELEERIVLAVAEKKKYLTDMGYFTGEENTQNQNPGE